ncbi:L,D-transpeptidase family protein [Patescibacteria group bacterium]|nr:L,D-transpeptidase family protein [Patescibacteria group bacterium]
MDRQRVIVTFISIMFITAIGALFLVPRTTNAAFSRNPEVRIFSGNTQIDSFEAFDKNFQGGVQIYTADVGSDGVPEIIVAPGPGADPIIKILRADGSEINSFLAYETNMRVGINIAVGDLNNDGIAEIITAPRIGGAPHIRIFNVAGEIQFTPGFFAYDEKFRGGVSIAIGDLDGDGKNEIVTGAGAGGGPHVRVFDNYGKELVNFFPFHKDFRGGINVATANVDGGDDDELVVSVQTSGSPWVKVIKKNGQETLLGHFLAYDESFKGGVQISSGDIDGDGFDEIITAAGAGGGPQIRAFEGHGQALSNNFFAYEQDFRGGVNIASADLDGDGVDEIISAPAAWLAEGRVDLPKYVLVDLSEQRIYVYDYGRMVKTFLISSGLSGTPTNVGTFAVQQKLYSHLYQGEDYYFPNTLWNLRYDGAYLLHGAYWHNDFGRPKSHGCINIHYTNAEWLYNWAEVGTTVIIEQ